MKDIKSLTFEELEIQIKELGEKSFRAKQIYEWIHVKLVTSFDEMTNLSKSLRDRLKEIFVLYTLSPVKTLVSEIDGTRKYLFLLPDGNIIESVLMKYKHGNSVCISSQVGCRMGCKFCASTLDGLTRNLYVSEMLEQVYRIQALTGERVSNVVIMGAGEPLDNYLNLRRFITMISDTHGLAISQRNITVSTCGIVPKILELADENFQITLALSLHASNDEIRKKMMPVANKYSIREIIDACKVYFIKTKRRITFEYSLAAGVNDKLEYAKQLVQLIKGMNCHVNLIPINPVKERKFVQANQKSILEFRRCLEESGINVTVRREMGRDIEGACGQLRKSYLQNEV